MYTLLLCSVICIFIGIMFSVVVCKQEIRGKVQEFSFWLFTVKIKIRLFNSTRPFTGKCEEIMTEFSFLGELSL